MFPKKLTQRAISDPDFPVVETNHGKLRGVFTENGYIFRGVPYAKAKRFHMPEPLDDWDGIRDSTIYGPVCPEIGTPVPKDAYTVPHFWYPQDENCQYLNIWTRGINDNRKRNVLVWIHGGGYQHGSPLEIFSYDGEELAKYGDVVVVSVGHRLNVLGYLDLSEYGEQYRYSGTLGHADLIAALKWIHENISAFGGHPDNVTLFGQSGGGMKIADLLQCREADGLYHKVCIESAGELAHTQEDREFAAQEAKEIVKALGLSAANIEEIETVPFHKLAVAVVTAMQELDKQDHVLTWGPVADGDYYLGNPHITGFRSETADIPVLIGTCFGESSTFAGDADKENWGNPKNWDAETLKNRLIRDYGERYGDVIKAFRQAYPDRPLSDAVYVDSRMRPGHIDFVRLRTQTCSAPVYNWMLSLRLPAYSGSTPWHNADEPFFLHQTEYIESTYMPGVTDVLADRIADALLAFADSGNPNHDGLPQWEASSPDKICTMMFDETCGVRINHDEKLVRLLHEIRPKRKRPMNLGLGGGPRNRI